MVRQHQTRNLEIPGSMRSLSSGRPKGRTRWHRPGMTTFITPWWSGFLPPAKCS